MVTGVETAGEFRIKRLRFQDAGARGTIASCDRLIGEGRAAGRVTLRIPASVVGTDRTFHPGQTIAARGRAEIWCDPRTGLDQEQISVVEWHEIRPYGASWIDYVASSPVFPGVGRVIAERVWNALGPDVYDILGRRDAIELWRKVSGLSPEKAHIIVEGWASCGQERLVEWLDAHDVPRCLCGALLKAYQDQDGAVERLDADPYRLLAFGLLWGRVDDIARAKFGVGHGDPRRLHAAVVDCLMRDYLHGHTVAPAALLTPAVARTLGFDEANAAEALRLVYSDGGFVQAGPDMFQLRGVHVMESAIAEEVARRCTAAGQGQLDLGCDEAIDKYESANKARFRLTDEQRSAVRNGALLPFSIVVGGAGTGKTACLAALHHVVDRLNGRAGGVIQMALAGRAAKRMREATGREAVTIAGFLHTLKEERLEAVTHVIIDEASMLDVPGFYSVLRRLRGRAAVVLVGDDFQLPPIGAGKILHLLAHRREIPIVVLGRVWRQEDGNSIRTVATDIRSGVTPNLPAYHGIDDGVSIAPPGHDLPETVRAIFEQLGGLSPDSDICLLSPRRRAGFGNAHEINKVIHAKHFSSGAPVASCRLGKRIDTGFCVGDRFVCDVNHWEVNLMNGSLGRILRLATPEEIEAVLREREERGIIAIDGPLALAEIDGERRLLDVEHLLDCSWGYALTCHRAQGSEFDRVVVVLDDRADRGWLYTAITRGRRQVVLIGTLDQVGRIAATVPRVNGRRVGLGALLEKRLRRRMQDDHDQHVA